MCCWKFCGSLLEEELVSNDLNQLRWWDKGEAEFLFKIVPQWREGVTQLILIMVCMGFSNHLKPSNLSPLWRTRWNPIGSISCYQESHLKGRSGNADGWGTWCPSRAGPGLHNGCFPLWVILLSCLFCNQFAVFKTVLLSVRSEEGQFWGLEGRTGWTKVSVDAWTAPKWPRPTEGPTASKSFTL